MNKTLEQLSDIAGQGVSSLVFQQVLVGIGFVLLGLLFIGLVWVLTKKLQIPFNHPTAFVVYVSMLIIAIASLIWGGLHILNPEYYALLELKGFFK